MPVYEYKHISDSCALGLEFEVRQPISEPELVRCPECRRPVKRQISLVGISVPKTNTELRDLGFTKLAKRDDGVYENVTRREGDNRFMERGKPDSVPDISKRLPE